jgi:hypothetical protein
MRPAPDPVTGPILPPRDPSSARGRANVATVYLYARRESRVVWPGGRSTGGGRTLQRPIEVYDIDLGTHRATFSTDLPADGGGALRFPADIDIEWRVVDPALVVSTNLRDVANALEPKLQRLMSRVTAGVSVMSPSLAEERVNDALDTDAARRIGAERGLQIDVYAQLKATDEVVRNRVGVLRAQGENDVEEVKYQEVARKARQFAMSIEGGDLQAAALMMANDTSSMQSVMRELSNQRSVSQRETLDFINKLIGSGLVEKHEISEQIRVVMAWMQQATSAVIGTPNPRAVDHRPTAPRLLEAGAPEERPLPEPSRPTLRARRRMANEEEEQQQQEHRSARPAARPEPAAPEDDGYRDEYDRDVRPPDTGAEARGSRTGRRTGEAASRTAPYADEYADEYEDAPAPARRAPVPVEEAYDPYDTYDTEYSVEDERYEDGRGGRAAEIRGSDFYSDEDYEG